ncbi:MAG: amidase [Thermoleophilia bacterium]|jgi:aspartyl-tRNA(Asn)/glutamyl-tRNA(Gln) amidotransferase subunit A|nr:amidase [Thermoleophilia bacterium]
MSDLWYLPATEALRRFRERSLSPVELMEAVIARAEEVEPTVNALCVTYFDEALVAARAAEEAYIGRGEAPRPLTGLPVAVKDELPVAGQPCSGGSLLYADEIADHSAVIAERILAAGGIVHARTTTPEFSCAGFTHSRLWGVTRNPWNPDFAVGGSSGGSGAALASGTAALATGSDIGGSIRIPASFNGVVGFKPPFGRVPEEPPYNLDQYCHEGPLARTVADCALLQNVIAGPHPRDLVCVAPKLEIPDELEAIQGLTLALVVAPGDWPIDADVAANTRAAAEAFREAGATVEELELAVTRDDVRRATYIHFGAHFGADIMAEAEAHGDLMTPYALKMAEDTVAALQDGTTAEGLALEARIMEAVADVLAGHDLLLMPTVATRGLVAGDDYVDHGVTVGGVDLPDYFESLLTPVFNIASRCPVLNVPSGFGDNGVPTGLQIVGRPYEDVTVFRAGAAYERLRPWLDAPERRPLQG